METNLKLKTTEYFGNLFLWWFTFVITIQMFRFPEISGTFFRCLIIVLFLYTGSMFFFSLYRVLKFIRNNNKANIRECKADKLTTEPSSLFNYLNQYPVNHPYISFSIMGLIVLEQYTTFIKHIQESIGNITILNTIFPSLLLVILMLIFSNYIYHIKAKYIRRLIKITFFIYSPIILTYFLIGLASPLILIIIAIFSAPFMYDIFLFSSDAHNLLLLLVFPWITFYLLKCNFMKKHQLIEDTQ